MTNYNKELDRLFELARQEDPIVSFTEVQHTFGQSLASNSTGTSSRWLTMNKGWIFSLSSFVALLLLSTILINYDQASKKTTIKSTLPIPKNTSLEASKAPTPNNQIISVTESSLGFLKSLATPPPSTIHPVADMPTDTSHYEAENDEIILLSSEHLSDKLPETTTLNQVLIEKLKPKIQESKNTPIRFTINERTPTKQLSSISGLARRAGIEYTYVVDLKHKTIQEFNVHMSIPGTTHSCNIQVCIPKKEHFEINFGWLANSAGKAIGFSEDISIIKVKPNNTLIPTQAETICRQYEANGISYIEHHFNSYIQGLDSKASKDALLNTAGYALLKQGSVSEAVELFELNTRLFPKRANCWDSLGEAYYKSGDYEQAKASFQKALSIKPKLSSSINWLQKIKNE